MSDTIEISNQVIQYLSSKDEKLVDVFAKVGSVNFREPSPEEYFPHFVHTIIEQMMSKSVAKRNMDRLAQMIDGNFTPQSVLAIDANEMKTAGISLFKCQTIHRIATHFTENADFWANVSNTADEEIANELLKIKGIGMWTVKMFLLFCLGRRDILPLEDGAFMQVFRKIYGNDKSNSEITAIAEKWSPYKSTVAIYFYRYLDMGFAK